MVESNMAGIEVHEMIGLEVEVSSASHSGYIGMAGLVVDETKNTIVIDVQGKEKVVPKASNEFIFTLRDGRKERVAGNGICQRPQDRIKKLKKAR